MIKFGANDISKFYVGSNAVTKIYQGSTLVYSSIPTGPTPILGWITQNMDIINGVDFRPTGGDARGWTPYYIPVGGIGEMRGRSHITIFGLDNFNGAIPYSDVDYAVWRSPSGKAGTFNSNNGTEDVDVPEGTIERVRLDGSLIYFEYSIDEGSTWGTLIPPLTQPQIKLYPKITTDPGEYVDQILGLGFVTDGTTPETRELTINVTGIDGPYQVVVNGESWVNNKKAFPLNMELTNITPIVNGYTLTPLTFSTIMDSDKTLTFAASPQTPGVIIVGGGSGDLLITQALTGAVPGDLILVRAGTYGTINIKDFDVPVGQMIRIKNQGEVFVTDHMEIDNLKGVTISGDYVPQIPQGFKFVNVTYRAFRILGVTQQTTISNMLFKNVGDLCIANDGSLSNLPYDGTDATVQLDNKFLNLEFWNANGIQFGGSVNRVNSQDTGLVRNVEIANCYFHDTTDGGAYIFGGNFDGYNIHHNKFENLNAINNNHNGIAAVSGSGDFHHNYLNEYQGDAIRAWIFSRGDTPKKTRLYNNICANSRKYSAFEFQSFDELLYPGKTTTGIAECFQNTVYKMHYEDNSSTPSGNYHGVILDIFAMFGSTTAAWNNVGVNFPYPAGSTESPSYIWGLGPADNIYGDSNRYYPDLTTAKLTNVEFRVLSGSPLAAGDIRGNVYNIDDFYGATRVDPPTVGAVQI